MRNRSEVEGTIVLSGMMDWFDLEDEGKKGIDVGGELTRLTFSFSYS